MQIFSRLGLEHDLAFFPFHFTQAASVYSIKHIHSMLHISFRLNYARKISFDKEKTKQNQWLMCRVRFVEPMLACYTTILDLFHCTALLDAPLPC